MLAIGAIRECSFSQDRFYSSYFLVPKSDGGQRFVLNLKKLNQFVVTPHFKIDDIRTALKLTFKNIFMAKIDLKNAYLTIPLHPDSYKYFSFIYNKKFFEFLALPFGFSLAPYIFTKVLKVVASFLRAMGLSSVFYLDDIICFGMSKESCIFNVKQTLSLLIGLGWIINYDKCQLEPRNSCQYLGFVINSRDMLLQLPEEKRFKLISLVDRFSKLNKCKIREFAHFIGCLVAACPALQYSWLYTKNFEREKFLALLFHDNNYDSKMILKSYLQEDFQWWKTNILKGIQPILDSEFQLEIFSDASLTGWGAVCDGEKVSGFWKGCEYKLHINQLELKAAFLGLKCFARNSTNCRILLRIDNTTAISYINRMGGIQYPILNKITREIWQWCEARKIGLFASYIKSAENIADKYSRVKNIDTEWELSSSAYNKIVECFGSPNIDLFASRSNKKCEVYCSRGWDPECFQIDAFTLNWSNWYFYAFPPFSIILKILRKVVEDKAEGILVVPDWPSQAWYPLFDQLVIGKPILFQKSYDLLLSPCRSIVHPLADHLNLIAAKLSGKRL